MNRWATALAIACFALVMGAAPAASARSLADTTLVSPDTSLVEGLQLPHAGELGSQARKKTVTAVTAVEDDTVALPGHGPTAAPEDGVMAASENGATAVPEDGVMVEDGAQQLVPDGTFRAVAQHALDEMGPHISKWIQRGSEKPLQVVFLIKHNGGSFYVSGFIELASRSGPAAEMGRTLTLRRRGNAAEVEVVDPAERWVSRREHGGARVGFGGVRGLESFAGPLEARARNVRVVLARVSIKPRVRAKSSKVAWNLRKYHLKGRSMHKDSCDIYNNMFLFALDYHLARNAFIHARADNHSSESRLTGIRLAKAIIPGGMTVPYGHMPVRNHWGRSRGKGSKRRSVYK